MSSFMKSGFNLWACIFIAVLVACTRAASSDIQPDLKDGGFLSGDPCSAPCFYSIVPGLTTVSQAKDVVRSLGVIQGCDEFDNSSESGNRGMICRPTLILTFEENRDVVSGVGFQPSANITVAEAIKKYGNPDAVLVTSSSLPESRPYTTMMLFFDDARIDLALPKQEGLVYELEETIIIDNIGYSDESSYQLIKRYSFPWMGFVTYELSNP